MRNNNIPVDLSVRNNIQVIHCQCVTARTKGNANGRMLLSHLQKKLCRIPFIAADRKQEEI